MNTFRTPEELLAAVGARLASLPRRVVFVGGVTTSLYITDLLAPVARATGDVDIIVQVATYAEYTTSLRDELRDLGASEDLTEGAPLCRWVLDGVLVDVMAPDERVLGFTNRWYAAALENAAEHPLKDGTAILITTAPLFLATKVEAFRGRGDGDFRASKDIEDIIAVLDGRAEIVEEIRASAPELSRFLDDAFSEWAGIRGFRGIVEGHLPGDPDSQARAQEVLERLEAILAEG